MVWLWLLLPSFAADPAPLPPEAVSAWAELDRVSRLRARFEQVQHRSVLSRPLVSTGTLSFERPNRVRWEVETPARSLFVMNGTTVTTALPDLGHRESIDLAASPEAARFVQGLMVWLGGDLAAVQRDYTVVWKPAASPGAAGAVVVLTPKDPGLGRLLESITLTLGGAPVQIENVVGVEPGGDHVDIAFSSIERDPVLPAGAFSVP